MAAVAVHVLRANQVVLAAAVVADKECLRAVLVLLDKAVTAGQARLLGMLRVVAVAKTVLVETRRFKGVGSASSRHREQTCFQV